MTSFTLKLIAILAMVVDHAAAVFGQQFFLILFPELPLAVSYNILRIMRIIGRLTFPIMAFFIAEGCRKTRNMQKYMARLFGFALLAQIPFTLAFSDNNALYNNAFFSGSQHLTFLDIRDLNVLFTLGLGALAVFLYEKSGRKPLSYLLAALAIAAGELLQTDYSWYGVLLVFASYIFPTRKTQLIGMAAVLSILYLGYGNGLQYAISIFHTALPLTEKLFRAVFYGGSHWLSALAALLLLSFYNGERGRSAQYFFYIFYPAHLLVLVAIREIIRP